jgi:alkyl sulfatase BDS1-like metallo-beta-lactamase superfamily hydrolase
MATNDEPLYRSRPGGHDIRPAAPGETRRINDFIFLSEGLSNSYLIITAAGRIVVNTGMGFEAPIHKTKYDAIGGGPLRYIVFTQGHVDHVGGADVLREPGTEIVAQAGNAAQQADDARVLPFRARRSYFAFADAIDRAGHLAARQGTKPMAVPQAKPTPTITFDDRHTIELGGLRLELLSTPGGETADSLVIWLPQHRICFAGNLFSALFGHFPNLVTIRGDHYRDALRFVESLDRVAALEPEMLLVGHHQPVVGSARIAAELARLRAAVLFVHDETVRGMNEGKDVFTLMRDVRLPRELEVGEGYGKVSWSVRAIWENYAGWFHQHSTTELYPAPPWSVAADLVELAGADALAARAAAKLAADEPLPALHLAELVLRTQPAHPAALRTALAAHEMLLARSHNFWETQWLKHRIAALHGALAAAADDSSGRRS